jgi:hypothetical protein
MLAGLGVFHCQPDINRMQLKHTALRSLCVENGIDSSTVLFCKQEYLLASIQYQYSQVNLYNDSGFLIEPKTKDGFIEMSQLEFVFENLNQYKPHHCDSSKSLELEQENWVDGKGVSLKNSFVIVCYWSSRKFLQEQFFRMQELQKLKKHFSHISIRLVFINQDYFP